MNARDAWTILRWILAPGNRSEEDEQDVRVAVNRLRAERGQPAMTRQEFDADAAAVTAKMAENGNGPRGRLKTLHWAVRGH